MQTINENVEQFQEEEEEKVEIRQEKYASDQRKKTDCPLHERQNDLPVIEETEELETSCRLLERSTTSYISAHVKKTKKRSGKAQKIDLENIVKTSLNEWLTIESYIFLFGEQKIKEILDEKKLSDYFEKLNIAELRRDQQVKYMEICKRLHLQEMADAKFDKALLGMYEIKLISVSFIKLGDMFDMPKHGYFTCINECVSRRIYTNDRKHHRSRCLHHRPSIVISLWLLIKAFYLKSCCN